MITKSDRGLKWGNAIVVCLLAFLFLFPLKFFLGFLSYQFPLEYRDAAVISAATDFSNGVNFYRLYTYPGHIYLYGFLYPLMVAPFVNVLPHPIMAVRWIDALFLILFLIMSFDIFRLRKASVTSSLTGVLLLFNSACLIWTINGSRPDTAGLFIALLGVFVLIKKGPRRAPLIVSAVLCVISFYLKQYMLFSAVVIAVHLFLFVSKKKGLFFAALVATLWLGSLAAARYFFPLYYEYSILHHLVVESTSLDNLLEEAGLFFQYYWPLFFLFLFIFAKRISIKLKGKSGHVDVKHPEQPLISGISSSFTDTGAFVSLTLLVFVLGGHSGNSYIYFGQLLLPFLLYSLVPGIERVLSNTLQMRTAQIFILLFTALPFPAHYATDFEDYSKSFASVYERARECENIYDITPLAAMVKLENGYEPVYSNGHRSFAASIIPDPATWAGRFSSIPPEEFESNLMEWNLMTGQRLRDQFFDCVFTDSDMSLKDIAGYQKTLEWMSLDGLKIFLWEPAALPAASWN